MEVLLLCIFPYLKCIRNSIFVFILFSYTIRIWFSDAFRGKEADFLKFAEKNFSVFDFNTICRNCFIRKKSVFFLNLYQSWGKRFLKFLKNPPIPPISFYGLFYIKLRGIMVAIRVGNDNKSKICIYNFLITQNYMSFKMSSHEKWDKRCLSSNSKTVSRTAFWWGTLISSHSTSFVIQ